MDVATSPAPDPATAPPGELALSMFRSLRTRWLIIVLITAAALLAAIIYLRTAEYRHTMELRVAAAPGSASRSASLGSLAGLAAIAGVGLEAEATPFRLYQEDLTSRATATELAFDQSLMQQIFKAEWQDGGWRAVPGVRDRIGAMLLGLGGTPVPAWTPPDAARLQQWLAANIDVSQSERSPVVVLALSYPDPAFGKALLLRLHSIADASARKRALSRSRRNIEHLDARIAAMTELDHRQAMFATRAAEAQRLMLASNPAPYAAGTLGAATASAGPTSPRPGLILGLALFLGLGFSTILALLLGPSRR